MNDDKSPAPELASKRFRLDDIGAFRSSARNLDVDIIPLTRNVSVDQVVLDLPGCIVDCTKSSSRIVDAQLAPNTTAICFAMDDGVPVRFNGVERDRRVIAIGHSGAAYSMVERTPRHHASIIFTPEIASRGWPETGLNFTMHETSEAAYTRLRQLVQQVLYVGPPQGAGSAAAIRETFLGAIDQAFAETISAKWTTRANEARQFKVFRDVQAALSGSVAHPIYSSELAKEIGVSVRTMHDAVQRYRGMSLHRYLRLRRLWLVRQQLLAGTDSVKASALALGFWHLSDFSKSYRSQFGEAPSETLAKSRRV